MNKNEIPQSKEFDSFVIPYSESNRFNELAERMRDVSPTLGVLALTGEIEVSTDE